MNIKLLEEEGFTIKTSNIFGEDCVLVVGNMPTWTKDNLIYRSSMWTVKENKPISLSYKKFFNWGERSDIVPEPDTINKTWLPTKIDGCCDQSTVLITENGEKTIKEICETKYKGKILSYDINKNKKEYVKIKNYSILDNINDWYEIKLENNIVIKLTGNHRIWVKNLKCYRQVKDLDGTEDVLIT